MNTARPLVPSDLPADRLLIRAVLAHAVAAARGPGTYAAQICREYWPRDAATLALIERAATAPATIGGSGWADTLAAKATAAFIGSLQSSAAARLIAAAPQFNRPGYATISLPHATSTGTPLWVQEGAPIPVGQAVIAAPILGPPKKLGLIEVITREIAETGVDGGEAVVEIVLRDGLTRALDLSVFSATAGDATRPPGILNGVSATTPTTGGGIAAAIADLRLLIAATVTGGGSGNFVFVTSPSRQLAIETYAPSLVGRVFGGAAVPDTTLVCLDPNGFCSMFGADPDIRASRQPTLHFEDSVPLQLATGAQGSGVPASPARNVYQTDSIAIRCVLRCAWVMRVQAVSYITTGLTW